MLDVLFVDALLQTELLQSASDVVEIEVQQAHQHVIAKTMRWPR